MKALERRAKMPGLDQPAPSCMNFLRRDIYRPKRWPIPDTMLSVYLLSIEGISEVNRPDGGRSARVITKFSDF